MALTATSTVEQFRADPRARQILLGVVAVHLVMSIRFFHKYVDVAPWVLHAAYIGTGLAACWLVLRNRALLRLFMRTWTLVAAEAALLLLVAVAYPRADALREVGRGSDQDDCVRILVHNVFALRPPFGRGYFGDPCSTGPSEFFIYLPVQLSTAFFVVAPVLWTAVGFWVLRQVTTRPVAVLLTLSLFTSWLFLEMSSVGSDMVAIAWLFAAGTVLCRCGLRRARPGLVVVGALALVLFAGSRIPLAVVAAGSLTVLLFAAGRRAVPVVVSVLLATVLLYAGSYAMAPDSFTPGHLVGKSSRIVSDLGIGFQVLVLVLAFLAVAGLTLVASRMDLRAVADRHYYRLNLVVMALPMAAVAFWDLSRRGYDLGAWEGLHYLFLAVPALLVVAARALTGDCQGAAAP